MIARHEAGTDVIECQNDLVAFNTVRFVEGAVVDKILAMSFLQGQIRQTQTDGLLVFGVEKNIVTGVDRDGHAGVRYGPGDKAHHFATNGPSRVLLDRFGLGSKPTGQLHEVEREISGHITLGHLMP